MGHIVGLLMIIALVCAFRAVWAFIIWLRWHRKEVYPAEVGDLIFTEQVGRKKSRYTFLFYIGTGENRIKATYSETAESLARVGMPKGTQTEVYYDPDGDPGHRYLIRPPVVGTLKVMPVISIACLILVQVLILLYNWIAPLYRIK